MAQEPNKLAEPFFTETAEGKLADAPDDINLAAYGEGDNGVTVETEDDETKAIRENIETTRVQMSETIDAIQDKLSFSNISEQVKDEVSEQISNAYTTVKDSVYDATISKAGRFMKEARNEFKNMNFTKMASGNVIPLALIGTGIAIAVMNNKQKPRTSYGTKNGADDHSYGQTGSSGVSSMIGSAQNAAGDVANSVRGAADSAYRAVGDGTNAIGEQLSTLGSKSREQYEHFMDVNPLAVGVVALALGAVAGLAIPRTEYEAEYMGDASRKLMSQVEGTAKDAISKVQDMAKNVAGAVTEATGTDTGEKGRSQASSGGM